MQAQGEENGSRPICDDRPFSLPVQWARTWKTGARPRNKETSALVDNVDPRKLGSAQQSPRTSPVRFGCLGSFVPSSPLPSRQPVRPPPSPIFRRVVVRPGSWCSQRGKGELGSDCRAWRIQRTSFASRREGRMRMGVGWGISSSSPPSLSGLLLGKGRETGLPRGCNLSMAALISH